MLDSFYRAFVAEQRYLLYLDGLKVTILVSVIAILIGVALGTILALMRLTAEQKGKSTLLSKIAYVYIDIIRGTPTLTQLMIMYFKRSEWTACRFLNLWFEQCSLCC
jgi:His/Glu/Gln/Arg/opine family amino acid ABC transporter permease subunit